MFARHLNFLILLTSVAFKDILNMDRKKIREVDEELKLLAISRILSIVNIFYYLYISVK